MKIIPTRIRTLIVNAVRKSLLLWCLGMTLSCLAQSGALPHGAIVTTGANFRVSPANESVASSDVSIAADPKHPNTIAVAFSIPSGEKRTTTNIVCNSIDGGVTWSRTVDCGRPSGTGAPSIAYGPDSTLFYSATQTVNGAPLAIYRSTDAGKTWSGSAHSSDSPGLKVLMSKDGRTSSVPPGTRNTLSAKLGRAISPTLATDPGSQWFKGRLYAAWPSIHLGRMKILFSRSEDGGAVWTTPHVVNDDQPVNNATDVSDEVSPAMAVNDNGVVGVAWWERNDNASDRGGRVRFTASLDGGATFLPSVQVSEGSNSDRGGENWQLVAQGSGGADGGTFRVRVDARADNSATRESVALAADAAGIFHTLWVDNRTGIPQVWTSVVVVHGTGIRHGSADLAELRDISKYFRLELGEASLDKRNNLVTVNARLRSTRNNNLTGPIKVRVLALESALGGVQVANADNGQQGAGAVWDFTNLIRGNTLAPGETTGNRALVFRLADLRHLQNESGVYSGLLELEAQVLGNIQSEGNVSAP
jgi:hypothetical protein